MNQASTHECACDVAASQIKNYDLLSEHPIPFLRIFKSKLVMAAKHNNCIKLYFIGKKYWSKCYGIRSTIINKYNFNTNFVTCLYPDLYPDSAMLMERQPCAQCGITKFIIEFAHNTHKENARSKVCSLCAQTNLKNKFHKPLTGNISMLDRTVKSNFLKYMIARPHYFEHTFNCKPTLTNIENEFQKLNNRRTS